MWLIYSASIRIEIQVHAARQCSVTAFDTLSRKTSHFCFSLKSRTESLAQSPAVPTPDHFPTICRLFKYIITFFSLWRCREFNLRMKSLSEDMTGISSSFPLIPYVKVKDPFGAGHRAVLPASVCSTRLSKGACVVVPSHKCCTLLNTQWFLQFSVQYSKSFFWKAITKLPKGTGNPSASTTQIAPFLHFTSPEFLWPRSSMRALHNHNRAHPSSARKLERKWNQAPLTEYFKALLQITAAHKRWAIGGRLIRCHYSVGSAAAEHHLRLARCIPTVLWEEKRGLLQRKS